MMILRIGIITERDFVTKISAEGRPIFTEIKEVMSSPTQENPNPVPLLRDIYQINQGEQLSFEGIP